MSESVQVIIVQMKDEKWVLKFLKEHSTKFYTRVVKLKEEDCKVMMLQIPACEQPVTITSPSDDV